ncbi:MAG: ABC transporter permease subunit, partial [Mesorhizobium sp.]
QDEINAHGWMIWPPVRYSYRTVNNAIPEAAPTKPSWLYDVKTRCNQYPQGAADPNCVVGNWNWLGTDDQALLFQRFIEIWSAIPVLYLLLIVAAILPPGFFILLGLMLLFSWVALVGVVRAEFLRARNFEYVNAARALGVPNGTIMFRHLLPNAMVATLTFLPFLLSGSISTLTSL